MKISLPLIDRLKVLSRVLINDDPLASNRPRSYETDGSPSRTQMGSQQSPSSGVRAIKSGAIFGAPPVYARGDRFWSINQGGGRDVEHTQSNLG